LEDNPRLRQLEHAGGARPGNDPPRVRHLEDPALRAPEDGLEAGAAARQEARLAARAVVDGRRGQHDVAHAEPAQPREVRARPEPAVEEVVLREVDLTVPDAGERGT